MSKNTHSDALAKARQESIPGAGRAAAAENPGGYKPNQEIIVLGITAVIAIILSLTLDRFLTVGNIFALLRSISILGVFSLGMAIVVIAKGIDLSVVAIGFAMGALFINLVNVGWPIALALCVCFVIAFGLGVLNGFLISIVEIPALFTTLASWLLFGGIARMTYVSNNIANLEEAHRADILQWGGNIAGSIPIPVIIFLVTAFVVYLFLSRTVPGRFIYAHGDNADAARLTGIAVRPLTMLEYGISGVIGCVAGMVMMASSGVMQFQIVDGTMIYDIILVVVIGGVSLVGGRGGVICVIAGALLIGVVRNALVMLDIDSRTQGIIIGVVMLIALVVDSYVHPRDEETAKQGDI
jgi:ribose transport system permease protein